jgi:hypothetical protein
MPNDGSSRPATRRLLSAALALAAAPAGLAAQATPASSGTGAGWTAWYGCWAAALDADDAPAPTGAAANRRVCVLPAAGEAVELRSIEDGRVVRRDTVDASGARRPRTREGCRGSERASWSNDRRRVFTESEYACEGGVTRTARGVLALTTDGQWLDVRALYAAGPARVQVARFRPVTTRTGELPDVDALIASRGMSIDAARGAAGAALTPDGVVEATQRAGGDLTAAWIATVGEPFTLTGRQLMALRQAGVPGQVTDMMIAVSHPRHFAVASADGRGTPRPAERVSVAAGDGGRRGGTVLLRPGLYDPFWGAGYGGFGYRNAYGLGFGDGAGFGLGWGGAFPGGWFTAEYRSRSCAQPRRRP